jgi:GT2 family glycosyltransferase
VAEKAGTAQELRDQQTQWSATKAKTLDTSAVLDSELDMGKKQTASEQGCAASEAEGLRARIRQQQRDLEQTQEQLDWLRQHPAGRIALRVERLSQLYREALQNLGVVLRYQRIHGTRACIPAEQTVTASESVAIAGWACSSDGIDKVEFQVDGVTLREIPITTHRADVAAIYSDLPGVEKSGFTATIDTSELAPGQHDMAIILRDLAGNSQIHARALTVMTPADLYHRLFMATRTQGQELTALLQSSSCGDRATVFELWVDAAQPEGLELSLQSIAAQQYPHWCCHIVAAAKQTLPAAIDEVLAERFSWRRGYSGIDAGTADEPILLLRAGEMLAPDALLHFAARLTKQGTARIVYSDHDREAATGVHQEPCFKPDWSPEHLLCRDYIGAVYVVRRGAISADLMEAVDTQSPAWRYDLLLRLTEQTSRVEHISRVLWTQPITADLTDTLAGAEQRVVEAALARRDCNAEVLPLPVTTPDGSPIRRIRRKTTDYPGVSIIIPTTGRLDLLRPCVESLLTNTAYPDFELIFLDNGRGKYPDGIAFLRDQGLRVIECNERFNWSRLNNIGAVASDGEVLLFLNDDIEIIEPHWLGEMVSQLQEPDVGTVGSLLLYPDGRIQHAGVFLVDHGGGARHTLQFQHPDHELYQAWQHTTREVTASTGACLMLRREVFEQLGGFDEDFAIAFGDISICLHAIEHGYRNLWTPHCRLIHHESVSRENANIGGDETRAWELFGDKLRAGDPYYKPNLVQDRMDCGIDLRHLRRPVFVPPQRREPQGLNLIGYIRAEMGVAEGTRSLARAMDAVDFPFVVINYEHGNPSRMGDDSWSHRIVDKPLYPVNVLHVNADVTAEAVKNLGASVFKGCYNIGYWAWELPEFPDYWLSSFEHLDEVWTPSEFVRQAVQAKSPVPVIRIPHSVEKGPGPYLRRPYFDLPEKRHLFLTMYDTHSILERKNPGGAIAAFRHAFPATDSSVGLVLKVNNATPDDRKELQHALGDAKNIFIIEKTMTRYEVDSLMHCCDCLVSLHRSEGFGLPIAEAMALGRAVIATPWSGNADFTNEQTAACVNYELVEVGRDCGPYKAHQHWAEPDIEHAAWWMRELVANARKSHLLGAAARAGIRSKLGVSVVGAMIKERFANI